MLNIDEIREGGLRALICISITQEFFNEPRAKLKEIGAAIEAAYADLQGRFGVTVLGTFDDDLLQCGPRDGFPFISYILAEVPDVEAAMKIANVVRTPFGEGRLAQYLKVEARIGHRLFFGNA